MKKSRSTPLKQYVALPDVPRYPSSLSTFQLLGSLRQRFEAPNHNLGVSEIDRLLNIFKSRPTLPQRQDDHSSLRNRLEGPPGTHPPVLEITGASACSGKTQLLYFVIVIALLPQRHEQLLLGGRGTAVVFMDLAKKFSVLRVQNIMKHYILSKAKQSSPQFSVSPSDLTCIITSALTHLHVFAPSSTLSLIKTLEFLPTYLLANPSTHFSANRSLGIFAISEVTAFLAQDRFESDMDAETRQSVRTSDTIPNQDMNSHLNLNLNPSTTKESISLLISQHQRLVSRINDIRRTFSSPVIMTSTSPYYPSTSNSSPSTNTTMTGIHNPKLQPQHQPHQHHSNHLPTLRPPLPTVYTTDLQPHLHLLCSRDRISKFSAGMSIEEASVPAERGQRWEAVRRGGFGCWVNWWGSGGWGEDVREKLRRMEKVGEGGVRFWVDVDGEGVRVGN